MVSSRYNNKLQREHLAQQVYVCMHSRISEKRCTLHGFQHIGTLREASGYENRG